MGHIESYLFMYIILDLIIRQTFFCHSQRVCCGAIHILFSFIAKFGTMRNFLKKFSGKKRSRRDQKSLGDCRKSLGYKTIRQKKKNRCHKIWEWNFVEVCRSGVERKFMKTDRIRNGSKGTE